MAMVIGTGISGPKTPVLDERVKGVTDFIQLTLIVPHQKNIGFLLVFIRFLFLMGVQHFNPFDMEIARRNALLMRPLTGAARHGASLQLHPNPEHHQRRESWRVAEAATPAQMTRLRNNGSRPKARLGINGFRPWHWTVGLRSVSDGPRDG